MSFISYNVAYFEYSNTLSRTLWIGSVMITFDTVKESAINEYSCHRLTIEV